MQSMNGMQYSNFQIFKYIFTSSNRFAASSAPAPVIFVVPLTSMLASLQLHKRDLNNEVLKLIWQLMLYVSLEWSFISTQFFVLNRFGWFGVLPNRFIIFWYSIIMLLY